MDDPREILKAAGVECAEMEEALSNPGGHPWTPAMTLYDFFLYDHEGVDEIVLVLARLVAKQATDMKKAETFIALLKGMVEQLEDEGEYDLDELLKRVRDA